MFAPSCSTESDHPMRAWRRIQDKMYRDFHSVTCIDHRWGILFILVPLSGKLPKAAESSKLCLPSSEQKCSLHMHPRLLDGCKASYLPEGLIMVPAYS